MVLQSGAVSVDTARRASRRVRMTIFPADAASAPPHSKHQNTVSTFSSFIKCSRSKLNLMIQAPFIKCTCTIISQSRNR